MIFQTLFLVLYATDCDLTLDFFKSLNMHITDPIEFNLIPLSCCNYQSTSTFDVYTKISIDCTSTSVTSIQIYDLNINGSINATTLPKNISYLDLSFNLKLTCEIPNNLPNSISTLSLSTNRLSGSIPNQLPSNLVTLDLQVNNLNGTIPNFPPNLRSLMISSNKIKGTIPINLPSGLTRFYSYYNQLTGSINYLPDSLTNVILDFNLLTGTINVTPSHSIKYSISYNLFTGELMQDWPISLTQFYVAHNQLIGILPHQLLKQSTALYVYENQFTGCLNTTLICDYCALQHNQFQGPIVLQKPTYVSLAFNLFTNVTILNTTAITKCEIDFNPLLNVNNLPSMCTKTGLFVDTSYKCATRNVTSLTTQKSNLMADETTVVITIPTRKIY
eukprot:NODE_738_length_4335_cov_0.481350.p2 type:complete len:389 gc:universal NODE_738_length_4335_cov_0.481350:3796-2630(-)